MELTVGRSFKLGKKLGAGAFGEIYLGINTRTQHQVAVKLQPVNTKHPQLFYQAKLITYLQQDDPSTDKGIPQVYFCSSQGEYNIMVMDLLGPSLQDLFNFCNRKFQLKTTLIVGEQMLSRIQFVHKKQFLHRDIKPDNFLIGTGKKSSRIFMIDFGLAKKYVQRDGRHIPYRDNKNLTGTARYASVNTHLGIQQGRRDDLESLGYVLVYFLRGSLPWQNLKANNKKDKYERIMQKKLSTSVQSLCKGLPVQFCEMIQYSRNMIFDQEPDYQSLQKKFTGLYQRQGYQRDNVLDWNKCVNEKRKRAE